MGGFIDALQAVDVQAVSAGRVVKVRMRTAHSTEIRLHPDRLSGVDAVQLAGELESGLRLARRRYADAVRLVVRQRLGSTPPPAGPAGVPSDSGFRVVGTSPRGKVKVGFGYDGRIKVLIDPSTGSAVGVNIETLTAEISAAVHDAERQYRHMRKQVLEAVRQKRLAAPRGRAVR